MIDILYLKDDSTVDELDIKTGEIKAIGKVDSFIESICIPLEMAVGSEHISNHHPTLILKEQEKKIFSEGFKFSKIFNMSSYQVPEKIRVKFHWDGIEIVGPNMVTPNHFLIPLSKNTPKKWYFKTICKADTKPSFKPLYLTLDIVYENLLKKWFAQFIKCTPLFILICLMIIFPMINYIWPNHLPNYSFSKIYSFVLSKDSHLERLKDVLNPFLIFFLIYLYFWKSINEFFKEFYKTDESFSIEKNSTGYKTISKFNGIRIYQNAQ